MDNETIHISEDDLNQPHIVVGLSDLSPPLVVEPSDLLSPAPPSSPPQPEESCVFCHTPIEVGQQAVKCSQCNRPYHLSCWQTNKRCAVLGCTSKRHVRHSARQEAVELDIVDVSDSTNESWIDKLKRLFS